MSDIRLYNSDDDEMVSGLQSLYAAPSSEGYWNELEARIMARVADVELGWWTELDRWIRPAVAAAAARRRWPALPGRPRGRPPSPGAGSSTSSATRTS